MTTSQVVTLIIAAFAGVGGLAGVAALIKVVAEKRKLDAEVEKLDVDKAAALTATALSLLSPAKAEVEALAVKVLRLQREVDALTDRLKLASRLLDEHGIPFPPVPEVEHG